MDKEDFQSQIISEIFQSELEKRLGVPTPIVRHIKLDEVKLHRRPVYPNARSHPNILSYTSKRFH